MVMFTGYIEVSVNFKPENWGKKFIILIRILYLIYNILINSQNLLFFLCELLMSFWNIFMTCLFNGCSVTQELYSNYNKGVKWKVWNIFNNSWLLVMMYWLQSHSFLTHLKSYSNSYHCMSYIMIFSHASQSSDLLFSLLLSWYQRCNFVTYIVFQSETLLKF